MTGARLRLLACGSVDDGKSTLLGRLLVDLGQLADDHAEALPAEAETGEPDYALVLDGLEAEREQAITIDLAWRHLATPRRRWLVADAPGHEQYTRNMVSGASTADAALLLVDVRHGLQPQTRRHLALLALLGVHDVALAVNKMDLVQWQPAAFEAVADAARACARQLGLPPLVCIPTSGRLGLNVGRAAPPETCGWYAGPTVLAWLDARPEPDASAVNGPDAFRMPLQAVLRDADGRRWLAGRVATGRIAVRDEVQVWPTGVRARVAGLRLGGRDLDMAVSGQSVTLALDVSVDAARGDLLAAAASQPQLSARLAASLVWLHDEPLLRGRSYRIRLGTAWGLATVSPIRHRLDTDTLQPLPAERLEAHQIGDVELELDRPLPFEPYATSRTLGGFILVDRLDGQTLAAGMVRFGLRRGSNLHWQALDVDRAARHALNGHGSAVVWLTGLSGAGKSTLANALARRLHSAGVRSYVLDGDNLRHGLSKDLGFTAQDRVENIRRAAEAARLLVDAGLVVIVALISPFRVDRAMARALFARDEFIEVHVDVPLAVAEQRDPKGLYAKARSGLLPNFTGIDSPYEAPDAPELRIDAANQAPDVAAGALLGLLAARGVLRS